MRPLVSIANVLCLVGSWLFALLGTYASLVTGMNLTLALIILFLWTILTGTIYRLTFSGDRQLDWRKALPFLFFALSATCFNYTFAFFRQQYRNEHGFPRRYYSSDIKE